MADDPRLGRAARTLVADPAHDALISVASLWETQVKVRVGKLKADLQEILAEIQAQGLDLLPVAPSHLLTLGSLPQHHGDPWDHRLITQANAEEVVLMSEDSHAPLYPVDTVTCLGIRISEVGSTVFTRSIQPLVACGTAKGVIQAILVKHDATSGVGPASG